MRIHGLLFAAVAGLALAGCQREDPGSTPAPTSMPAERSSPAPQTGSTSSSGMDTGRTVGQTVDDASVTAKLKSALLQAPEVKGTDVNVDTVNGKVTMKGAVENQAQANRAVQIARAVEGVREVDNQIMVKAKP